MVRFLAHPDIDNKKTPPPPPSSSSSRRKLMTVLSDSAPLDHTGLIPPRDPSEVPRHRVARRHLSASFSSISTCCTCTLPLCARPCCAAEAAFNNKGHSLFPGAIPPPPGHDGKILTFRLISRTHRLVRMCIDLEDGAHSDARIGD